MPQIVELLSVLLVFYCWHQSKEAKSCYWPTKLKISQFMPLLRKAGSHHKTALRQSLERNGHFSAAQSVLNFAIPPVLHCPTPFIPAMDFFKFEILLLSYLLMAMIIQYMNIYKANIYVMDYHLILFITIILLRRVFWLILKQTLASEVLHSFLYWSKVALKSLLLLSMFVLCMWSFYHLIQNSLFEDVLFLCYPFGVYFFTFGFTLNPYSHSVLFKLGLHQSQNMQQLISTNTSLFHQAVTLQSISLNSIQQVGCRGNKNKQYELNGATTKKTESNTKNGSLKNGSSMSEKGKISTCSQEVCTMSPDTIRYEAECLRTDFNLRMKQVLFNSLINAYYVALVPLKFTQNGWLYYDVTWSLQHIFFVWVNTFMLLINFLVPHDYIDGLHKCALHLGAWKKYTGQRETPHIWSALTIWPKAALVRHNKGLFRAVGIHNTAVPGDTHHQRFYFIFNTPLRLLNWLVILQLAAVLLQLYMLTISPHWYQCLSVVAMGSVNYYLLFRVLRERWAVQATMNEHATCTRQG